MEWTDEGIVLGVRRHGEANAILELMTREHGRHLGLVRGGAGSRLRPVLQPGNRVSATWRARLDEHLGNYAVEGLDLRAASLFGAAHAVYGVTHLAALCRLLPERDPHPQIYRRARRCARPPASMPRLAGAQVVRFELRLLAELGFGLDLDALRGDRRGRGSRLCVAEVAAARCRARPASLADRLLRLPAFLSEAGARAVAAPNLADGFALTGFFLARHVLEPRGLALPDARAKLHRRGASVRTAARCASGAESRALRDARLAVLPPDDRYHHQRR